MRTNYKPTSEASAEEVRTLDDEVVVVEMVEKVWNTEDLEVDKEYSEYNLKAAEEELVEAVKDVASREKDIASRREDLELINHRLQLIAKQEQGEQ